MVKDMDGLADRMGLSADAVAILMIGVGVLVILFPRMLSWGVGVTLIVLGVLFLVDRSRARRAAQAPPASAPQAPPPQPPPP